MQENGVGNNISDRFIAKAPISGAFFAWVVFPVFLLAEKYPAFNVTVLQIPDTGCEGYETHYCCCNRKSPIRQLWSGVMLIHKVCESNRHDLYKRITCGVLIKSGLSNSCPYQPHIVRPLVSDDFIDAALN